LLRTDRNDASVSDNRHEIRDAVRAQFPPEYHRQIDAERGYPQAFVEALTKAGWMASLVWLDSELRIRGTWAEGDFG